MSDVDLKRKRLILLQQQQAAAASAQPAEQEPRVLYRDLGGVGGRVQLNGEAPVFVSEGYSTSDPQKVKALINGATVKEILQGDFDTQALEQFPVAARGAKAIQGVPFVGEYADEAVGAVFGDDAQRAMRTINAAMDRQNPIESMGLQIGGAVAGSVPAIAALPGAALPAAAAKLRTIPAIVKGGLLGAGFGAVEGGAAGFGRGEGGVDNRLETAGQGAGFGAAAGAVFGGGAPIVGKAAQNTINWFRRTDVDKIAKMFGVSKDAAKVMRDSFEVGGDPDTARRALEMAGEHATLIDAGDAAQSLADTTIRNSPQAGEMVLGAVNRRAAENRVTLDKALTSALGESFEGPETALEAIADATRSQRQAAYDAAFKTEIRAGTPAAQKVTEMMQRIMQVDKSTVMDAVNSANLDIIANKRNEPLLNIVAHPETGELMFNGIPTVRQLDTLKKTLWAAGKGKMKDNPQDGKNLQSMAMDLRDLLVDINGNYKFAMQMGGDKIQQDNALELGQGILSRATNVEDVTRFIKGVKRPDGTFRQPKATPSERKAAKAGLRIQIDKILGEARALASDPNIEARQLKAAFDNLNSDNARAKITLLLGGDAPKLLKEIDAAQQSLLVRSATAKQSKTATRQVADRTVDDILSPSAAQNLQRLEPMKAAQQTVQIMTGFTDEFTRQQRQEVFNDVGKALLRYRGPNASAAFEAMRSIIANEPLTQAQNAALAKAIADVGFVPATVAGQRDMQRAEDRYGQ